MDLRQIYDYRHPSISILYQKYLAVRTHQIEIDSAPDGISVQALMDHDQLDNEAELGRSFFFDRSLSKDSTISCGSCHLPASGFADTVRFSKGVSGRLSRRNTPSLINVFINNKGVFWDGRALTLESQVSGPFSADGEMGQSLSSAVEQVNSRADYAQMLAATYRGKIDSAEFVRAISAYVRTLMSFGSRVDRFRMGDVSALTPAELRGAKLFYSSRTACSQCHGNANFSRNTFQSNGLSIERNDSGRYLVTHKQSDVNLFKVPSLRNVANTAPYMHDGRFSTLREVIDYYNRGGDGAVNASRTMGPLHLSESEISDLIQFLTAMTDSSLVGQTNRYLAGSHNG